MTLYNKFTKLQEREQRERSAAQTGEDLSRADKEVEATDVDVLSAAQAYKTMGEPAAKAYYIGPWGENMSVFAAKVDHMVSPSPRDAAETRLSGRMGADEQLIDESSRSFQVHAGKTTHHHQHKGSESVFPDIHERPRYTDPGAEE